MTAPTHQGVSTAGDGNGTGITGVTRPTTTNDDVHGLDMYYESGSDPATGAIAFSNGTWTLVDSQVQVGTTPDFTHVRYISRHNGEASTFNITWNANIGSCWRSAVVNTYRLVDTTTPQDATATEAASGSSSTSATAPGLTVATADALVVYSEADYDGRTVTPPGGSPTFTEHTDFANLEVASATYTSTGATGDKTGTLNTASFNASGLLALRPATPGGGGAQDTPELRGRPYGLRGQRHMTQILAQ